MTSLADRQIEIVLRNKVYFGVGAIARLPEVVAAAGGSRVFVVTDPGVRASGVIDRALTVLTEAGVEHALFAEVEPNPAASTVERGATALRAFGLEGTVIVPIGGGSSMDTAKALDLRAANEPLTVWELEYDGVSLAPGRPVVAVPTTAGTGAETNSFGVITDEVVGRKGYIGHPSLLPVATILDPALTVGLPPAATAATGIDAMTHSLESLLSANPNPFAESTALGVIRTVAAWLPRAVSDGTDLEARSQMLLASHLAGVGQASGTGRGPRPCPWTRAGDSGQASARDGPGRDPARGPRLLPWHPRPRAGAGRRRAQGRIADRGRGDGRRGRHRGDPSAVRGASASDRRCGASGSTSACWTSSPRTRSPTPRSATRRGSRRPAKRGRSWRPSWAEASPGR